MEMIEIFIIMALVYAQVSLFASIIQELIAGIFALRGKMLTDAIKKAVGDEKKAGELINNSLFTTLRKGVFFKNPSYLSPDTFIRILFRSLGIGQDLEKARSTVEQLPAGALREALLSILDEAGSDYQKFRDRLEVWYNDYMDRVSGWYKRQTQWILLAIGICLAVSMDVDTIEVFGRLKKDAGLRTEWVQIAEKTSTQVQSVQNSTLPDSLLVDSLQTRLDSLHQQMQRFSSTYEPLGIGFQENECPKSKCCWLSGKKWLGWILTALAVSLGANFWFDLLRKFIQVRNAGAKPGENETAGKSQKPGS